MSPLSPGRFAADSCSARSAELAEPLAGTAPVAAAWLAVEQPGPWGARALTQSRLDPELGALLGRRAESAGVRVSLIRRPGPHADQAQGGPRRVLAASTRPGAAAVRALSVNDPRELLDLDLAALASGSFAEGAAHPRPALLVCTNGRRDRCCALSGRALLEGLAGAADDGAEIWEADHLGGHRFAPTAVLLPTGYVYGRLDARTALSALDAAGRGEMTAESCRGRSTWSRAGQAADLALRAELAEYGADAVRVVGEQPLGGGGWSVDLVAPSGGYRALVAGRRAPEPRPESCGKASSSPLELRVDSLEKVEPTR